MTDLEFREKVIQQLATLDERSRQQAADIQEIKDTLKGNTPLRMASEAVRLVGALLAGIGGGYMRGGA